MKRNLLIVASLLFSTLLAQVGHADESVQTRSRIENQLKAVAHSYYAEFDKGTSFECLQRLLSDSPEFSLAGQKINSLGALENALKSANDSVESRAHILSDVFVHATNDPDEYVVTTPHVYLVRDKGGTESRLDITSRMRVQIDSANIDGEPKINSYLAIVDRRRQEPTQGAIASQSWGELTENDVKAFIYRWYSHTDARNPEKLLALTAEGDIDFDLLGTKIANKQELASYFAAVQDAQLWGAHKVHSISLEREGESVVATFFVQFVGEVKGVGVTKVSNHTRWILVKEGGEIKLKHYRLQIL